MSLVNADYLLQLASQPLSTEQMLRDLEPPKHFDNSTFESYLPQAGYRSQVEAVLKVKQFIAEIPAKPRLGILSRFFDRASKAGHGLYLDGGFGVGKTHLLAAAYHDFFGAKCYLSFQELMFLVGMMTLDGVAKAFSGYSLMVLDELELDDPANTRITTNLLGQLFDAGVSILTSSNTPPGALGEGRFSVEDFRRELGVLTDRFETLRIDGDDYRDSHTKSDTAIDTWVSTEDELAGLLNRTNINNTTVLYDTFNAVLESLGKVHPMRIRKAITAFDTIVLHNAEPIDHPHKALRFVYFIDKAYDHNIRLFVSASVEPKLLFEASYFIGGDTKKYLRTISRLTEMTHILL